MIRHLRTPLILLLVALPLTNCRCADRVQHGWDLGTESDAAADIAFDTEPPPPDTTPPFDTADLRDTADVADVIDTREDVDAWQTDEVFSVQCPEKALRDRTSLIVDDEGTIWVGFHKFASDDCEHSTLVVVHKRLGGRWVREDIQPHEGIFGLSSIEAGRPIAVFPHTASGTFKAAHRRGDRKWEFHTFDVGGHQVDAEDDGFDVTEDGERFYVTFAEDNASQVRLYSYDTTASNPSWKSLESLKAPDPRAAMERGLRADPDDSVYLVHKNHNKARFGINGRYGLARYDKADDRWPDRTYFSKQNRSAEVHSFVITDDFRLCMSSLYNRKLMVTCGTMFNLQMERKVFDQRISQFYPSSLVEGPNGKLYVAYQPEGDNELRVAKRTAEGEWSVRTVFDRSAYGISTAIDTTGHMVIAFYTCENRRAGQCSLKVLREHPDAL